jgi:hypothetical protein
MELNPYQSPQPGDPKVKEGAANPDPVVQLLTEIRDMQRESLELGRQTILRQQKYRLFPFVIMMVAFAFMGFSMYRTMTLRPSVRPPTPARVAPAPAPAAPPTTFRAPN